jgi:hypothetical protein
MGVVRAISQNRTLPQMRRFGVRLVQTGPQPVAGGQIISSDMGEEIRNAWRRKSEILGSEVRSDELPIASQLLQQKDAGSAPGPSHCMLMYIRSATATHKSGA